MSLATPTKVEQLQKTLHATAKRTSLYRGLRVPKRESLSESRMREICTSGLMSGRWKRSMAGLVRHRQTKEPVTDRPRLNHRATSRLYSFDTQRFRPFGRPIAQSIANANNGMTSRHENRASTNVRESRTSPAVTIGSFFGESRELASMTTFRSSNRGFAPFC